MTAAEASSGERNRGLVGRPEVRQVLTGDGLRITFQCFGAGSQDLLVVSDMSMTLESVWDDPPTAGFLRQLANFRRVILVDTRSKGMSDGNPNGAVPTLEQLSDDLHAVLRAVDSERAALLAHGENGGIAVMHATRFPGEVESLIFINSHARLSEAGDYPFGLPAEVQERLLEVIPQWWGSPMGLPLVGQSRASQPPFEEWYARAMRLSGRPADIQKRMLRNYGTDVRGLLPIIGVPTLVVHSRDNGFVRVEHGRYLADHIAGAKLVELPGTDHIIPALDLDALIAEIAEFLTGSRVQQHVDRMAATILITDIVGSTETLSRVGDDEWSVLLDEHDAAVRFNLDRFEGSLVKSTGDGMLSIFNAPVRAIRCACSIREQLRRYGLEIRAGLHTGELQMRYGDVAGIAVHIAARVGSLADAGEVLVSESVSDLSAGSGISFDDRGDHPLKGLPGTFKIYAVRDAIPA